MFKKIIYLMLTMLMSVLVCSCGANQTQTTEESSSDEIAGGTESKQSNTESESTTENSEKQSESVSDILVAYFTWSGNTKEMAEHIAEKTGADLLKIEPATPYPNDYNETGEIAKVERDENQRPEIANLPESVDEYDSILIGYPIWWHTAPMIIGTFLENYDLTGIDIYPFTQSASMDTEQFENSMEFVRKCAGNGNVKNGLFTDESDIDGIDEYLISNGLVK